VDVSFRPLTDDDLEMLHGWLNEPGVVAWWEGDDVSWDGVVGDYGSAGRAERGDRTEHWVAVVDGSDVGWIQCYPTTDEPGEAQEWWDLGVDRTAAGIDYLVAEPGARGRGVGSAMIRAFVVDVVFGRHSEWTQAAAAPFVANAASWKALRRAGFRHVADVESDDGAWSLHVIDRGDV